jgi:hypothetical protein
VLPEEYFYNCLSLCVIDAVYSIGVRYEGVRNVVARYREFAGLNGVRIPGGRDGERLTALASRIEQNGPEWFAENVFRNCQRTSTRNGILKSEAVLRFSHALAAQGVHVLRDLESVNVEAIEDAIRQIPGQRSGISFRYFLMLAGSDDLIKPDRMIQRFLAASLNRTVDVAECQSLVGGAVSILRDEHPELTPRLLDWLIWNHQRAR